MKLPAAILAALLLSGCVSTLEDRRLARFDWYECVTNGGDWHRRHVC